MNMKSLRKIMKILDVVRNDDWLKQPQSSNEPLYDRIPIMIIKTISNIVRLKADCLTNKPTNKNKPSTNSNKGRIIATGFIKNTGRIS